MFCFVLSDVNATQYLNAFISDSTNFFDIARVKKLILTYLLHAQLKFSVIHLSGNVLFCSGPMFSVAHISNVL